MSGPERITGKFATWEDLHREIFRLKGKKYSQRYIAGECEISESMVSNIINSSLDKETEFAILKQEVNRKHWWVFKSTRQLNIINLQFNPDR